MNQYFSRLAQRTGITSQANDKSGRTILRQQPSQKRLSQEQMSQKQLSQKQNSNMNTAVSPLETEDVKYIDMTPKVSSADTPQAEVPGFRPGSFRTASTGHQTMRDIPVKNEQSINPDEYSTTKQTKLLKTDEISVEINNQPAKSSPDSNKQDQQSIDRSVKQAAKHNIKKPDTRLQNISTEVQADIKQVIDAKSPEILNNRATDENLTMKILTEDSSIADQQTAAYIQEASVLNEVDSNYPNNRKLTTHQKPHHKLIEQDRLQTNRGNSVPEVAAADSTAQGLSVYPVVEVKHAIEANLGNRDSRENTIDVRIGNITIDVQKNIKQAVQDKTPVPGRSDHAVSPVSASNFTNFSASRHYIRGFNNGFE